MTTPTAKAITLSIGFSGHAYGNPFRYVLKAPSEPKSVVRLHQLAPSVPTLTAASAAYGARRMTLCFSEPTAKILSGNGFLTGTPLKSSVLKEQIFMKEIYGKKRR